MSSTGSVLDEWSARYSPAKFAITPTNKQVIVRTWSALVTIQPLDMTSLTFTSPKETDHSIVTPAHHLQLAEAVSRKPKGAAGQRVIRGYICLLQGLLSRGGFASEGAGVRRHHGMEQYASMGSCLRAR